MLNIGDFNLGVSCVEQTDFNKDRTHTDHRTGVWTHQKCEFSPSDSYTNKHRKPEFPESGRKFEWCECSADLEENPGQTVTHDGRQLSVGTDMTSRCFTHPPCLQPWGLERRRNKDTPASTFTIWCLTIPFEVGVDWWRTQCTEESQASELQTDKCNIRTCTHTCQKHVCDMSMNTDPSRSYSDLNFLILRVSQT